MIINLKLLESDSEISNMILYTIKEILNNTFDKSLKNLRNTIPAHVKNAIMAEPEYGSLINGKLRYEFGIPDASNSVNAVVDAWANNINIETIPIVISGNSLKGGFSINMIQDDYSDVLNLAASTVKDSKSGALLPWLEWLLLYGGQIIIKNYKVQMGPNVNSRTGMAIMVSSKENWRVPPEFAGTKNNNWISRALTRLDITIPDLIQKEIENNI
jgi:hypothetical protein